MTTLAGCAATTTAAADLGAWCLAGRWATTGEAVAAALGQAAALLGLVAAVWWRRLIRKAPRPVAQMKEFLAPYGCGMLGGHCFRCPLDLCQRTPDPGTGSCCQPDTTLGGYLVTFIFWNKIC